MRTMCDIVFTCEANDKKQIGSNQMIIEGDNFEILGFDFMVDDIGDVWMLEINEIHPFHTKTSLMKRWSQNLLGKTFD